MMYTKLELTLLQLMLNMPTFRPSELARSTGRSQQEIEEALPGLSPFYKLGAKGEGTNGTEQHYCSHGRLDKIQEVLASQAVL